MTFQRLMLTVFGLGFLRPAPGTWGSVPPVVLALILVGIGLPDRAVSVILLVVLLLFSLACVGFGAGAERSFGRKDPSEVVADEVAGQCVALLFLPWRMPGQGHAILWNLTLAILAFIGFRLFDILKPPPIRQLQSLPAGWGILVDDLAAGLVAGIITQVLARLVL